MTNKNAGQKKSKHIMQSIMTKAIGAVVVATILMACVGLVAVKTAYETMCKEELIAATYVLSESYDNLDGEWKVVEDDLYKGEENVSQDTDMMDELKEETGLDFTIFYDKTSMASSLILEDGSRAVGTEASSDVIEKVYTEGEQVYLENIDILGLPYYGYYMPLYDGDHNVVGMVFAGRESSDLHRVLSYMIGVLLACGLGVIGIVIAVSVTKGRKLNQNMKDMTDGIMTMTAGDLHIVFDDETMRRPDEIGDIARDTTALSQKLQEIMNHSKDLADHLLESGNELNSSSTQAGQAADQVAAAVEEIAKGAVSQAEHTQSAAENMDQMGLDIDSIAQNAENMSVYSEEMRTSCDQTVSALDSLSQQSDRTVTAMKAIDESIRTTGESIKSIAEAAQAIEGIANQTNLLALNASIEAARAGEEGRGFAVVASEIGQLASQSKGATQKIAEIIQDLLQQSDSNLVTMENLDGDMVEQMEQLSNTKSNMSSMAENVMHVSNGMQEIASRVDALKNAKEEMVEIVQDLSAISEENAASTEETNASVEELDSTFALISDASERLAKMAKELDETVAYFHV